MHNKRMRYAQKRKDSSPEGILSDVCTRVIPGSRSQQRKWQRKKGEGKRKGKIPQIMIGKAVSLPDGPTLCCRFQNGTCADGTATAGKACAKGWHV